MAVRKRPNSKRNLDMAIRRLAGGEAGYLPARTMVANAIVCQLMPEGAVKGGSALKIRFGDARTRATTDLDAARAGDLAAFSRDFERNLAAGWNGFSGRLVPKEPPSPAGVPEAYVMRPFDVKLAYLGSPWCTVAFELGHDEIGDADDPDWVVPAEAARMLAAMGFPEPGPVPLMPLHHQVAQKLHAVSAPGSSRAHDLVDLQLIAERGGMDLALTRDVCARLFAYRRSHAWPPSVEEGEGWAAVYAEQSAGLGVLPTVAEAVEWANALVREIDAAGA